MRRAIMLSLLVAACHPRSGDEPNPVQIDSWEVTNGSPCDAYVRISSYGGQLVQSLGTVAPGVTQTFRVLSTLTRGNFVSAHSLEPDGRLCQNNQNLEKKVVVKKLAAPE